MVGGGRLTVVDRVFMLRPAVAQLRKRSWGDFGKLGIVFMRPLIDRVNSTWAKVAVTLLGTLAVVAWLVLVPAPADAAVATTSSCDHVRVAQYGPADPCEPSPQTGEFMLVGVECAGAAGIGAVFGGWQGGAAGGLGCAWTHLW